MTKVRILRVKDENNETYPCMFSLPPISSLPQFFILELLSTSKLLGHCNNMLKGDGKKYHCCALSLARAAVAKPLPNIIQSKGNPSPNPTHAPTLFEPSRPAFSASAQIPTAQPTRKAVSISNISPLPEKKNFTNANPNLPHLRE